MEETAGMLTEGTTKGMEGSDQNCTENRQRMEKKREGEKAVEKVSRKLKKGVGIRVKTLEEGSSECLMMWCSSP